MLAVTLTPQGGSKGAEVVLGVQAKNSEPKLPNGSFGGRATIVPSFGDFLLAHTVLFSKFTVIF